jgi:CO/xanthine dehydrogenase Mo-binding subunit
VNIGRAVPRVDGRAKVTGRVAYAEDAPFAGLHAVAVRSPYPHALIRGIDISAVERIPGVVTLTATDLKDIDQRFGITVLDQCIVADERVRYVGDIVAAVAAPSMETATRCAELIEVDYEPLGAVLDPVSAMLPESDLVHPVDFAPADLFIGAPVEILRPNRNVCAAYRVESGAVDRAWSDAELTHEGIYRVPSIHHGHLEPHVATASWSGSALTVVSSTQGPSAVRAQLADLFRIPQADVRVVVPHVGGAYGAKSYAKLEPLVAALARKAGRAVRMRLTREEVFLTISRHAAIVRIRSGFTSDGRLTAREVEVVYDTGAYADGGPRACKKGGYLSGGPYRIPNQRLTARCVYTNKVPAGAFRGFGVPQVCWAYESHLDEIARIVGLDPVEIRKRNLLRTGDSFVTGEELTSVGLGACLEAVQRALGGAENDPISSSETRGTGVALSMKSMTTPTTSIAAVTLNADGSVHVSTSSVELGQGIHTVLGQIVGEVLSVEPSRVRVSLPDTDVTPFDQSTISSRSTFSMGNAAAGAARKVRTQLLALASDVLEASVDDLRTENGRVSVVGSGRGATYAQIIDSAFRGRGGALIATFTYEAKGGIDTATGRAVGRATECWMYAAVGAEVVVDRETGAIRVERIVSAIVAGRAINPAQCHLQNEGSMLTGLGSALFEELLYDGGQPTNASFLEYQLPSIRDHPTRFDSILIEEPHPSGPYGAKGVGESSIPAIAPAIGNAVAAALGGRPMATLPLRPGDVVAIDLARHP